MTPGLGDPPVSVPASGAPLEILRGTLDALHTEPLPGLPPLTGGLVGAVGWDACWYFHPDLTKVAPEELHLPDLALMLVADMVAIDHHDGSAWLIANAINTNDTETGVEASYADAVRRLDALASGLTEPTPAVASTHRPVTVPRTMRTSQGEYEESVREVKREIARGTCEQVVLSGRLDLECEADPLDVYRALRTINPSPYMYLLHLPGGPAGNFHVVGSSPETLIKVSAGTVTTFPIAGSRPRGRTPAHDRDLEREMLADETEVAEHVMLVDLAKDDLGQICTPESIDVGEAYAGAALLSHHAHHLHRHRRAAGGQDGARCPRPRVPGRHLSGSPRRKAIESHRRPGTRAPRHLRRHSRLLRFRRRDGHGDRHPHRGHLWRGGLRSGGCRSRRRLRPPHRIPRDPIQGRGGGTCGRGRRRACAPHRSRRWLTSAAGQRP